MVLYKTVNTFSIGCMLLTNTLLCDTKYHNCKNTMNGIKTRSYIRQLLNKYRFTCFTGLIGQVLDKLFRAFQVKF